MKSILRTRQKGNAMLLVLLGVVLFGALLFTVSRTSRAPSKISLEDAQMAAQRILGYAEKIDGAVQMVMLQNSCSASQLNFANPTVSGYTNAGAPSNNKCDIFNTAGGVMSYEAPPSNINDATAAAAGSGSTPGLVGQYFFTGRVCVDKIGTGVMASCAADSLPNEELLLIVPWISSEVCTAINLILKNPTLLVDPDASFDATKFTGSFTEGYQIGQTGVNPPLAGCYQSTTGSSPGAGYHFYYTLMSR